MKSVGRIADPNNSAAAALKVMRGWEWGFIDYDGQRVAYGKALGTVVSKLGMTGLARPQDAVLSLLCTGDLVARGDFHWQKYEDGHRHLLNGNSSIILPRQWIALASVIEEERRLIDEGLGSIGPVNLPRLGLPGCPAYEWYFSKNEMSVATLSASPGVDANDEIEEWFLAWLIDVWPAFVFESSAGLAGATNGTSVNVGGRPPVADWMEAALELAGQQYRGDFKPKTVADVVRALQSHLDAKQIHLSDSTIRPHAKQIFAALRTWDD